jgi:ligand-binding SRPBCC domain-containing protein
VPIYVFEQTQNVCASTAQCWAFFADAHNLSKLTPPSLDFAIQREVPPEMYPGLMIQYRVRPIAGIPVTWLTEITHVEPLRYFIDEQPVGPYRLWHHEHWFEALGPERTCMRDVILYKLPFGAFGRIAHALFVRPQLERIFQFRKRAIEELFPPPL